MIAFISQLCTRKIYLIVQYMFCKCVCIWGSYLELGIACTIQITVCVSKGCAKGCKFCGCVLRVLKRSGVLVF